MIFIGRVFYKKEIINDYLIERIKKEFPTHCVDGEEKQFGKSKYVWVCDSVDGTSMYARHVPVSVFSLPFQSGILFLLIQVFLTGHPVLHFPG